jgi:hypothetical protein
VFRIPIIGDAQLVRLRPNFLTSTEQVFIESNDLCFRVTPYSDQLSILNARKNEALNNIRSHYNVAAAQIRQFDEQLGQSACAHFRARKAELLRRHAVMEQIGIPLSRRRDTPETYSIPAGR